MTPDVQPWYITQCNFEYMADSEQPQIFPEHFKLASQCPVCNAKHTHAETRLLGENDGMKLVYVRCRKCKTSVVAVMFQNAFGITSAGLVTDLSGDEVLKFKDAEPVSGDDVLELYQALQKNQKVALASLFQF